MARKQEQVFPVYLIAGFLDSGKTSFINGILSDGFALEDRTLLLQCEEGEVEYDPKVLRNVTVVPVDSPDQLTPAFLTEQQKKCGAVQILVEFNGMWVLQDFYEKALPQNWVLYQIIVTAEGPTFESYAKNMASLMMEKLRNADMIVINRCDQALRDALRRRNLRLLNRQADIYLESDDGTSEDYMDGHRVRLRAGPGRDRHFRRGLRPVVCGDHGRPQDVRGQDRGVPGHDVQAPQVRPLLHPRPVRHGLLRPGYELPGSGLHRL